MLKNIFLIIIFIFLAQACSNKEKLEYEPQAKSDPYKLYQEGFNAFEKGDYFFANKKFSEAELNFETIEYAAKSAIMSSYALYGSTFTHKL